MIIVAPYKFRLSLFGKMKSYYDETLKNEIDIDEVLIVLELCSLPYFEFNPAVVSPDNPVYSIRSLFCIANYVHNIENPIYVKNKKKIKKEFCLTKTIAGYKLWNLTKNRLFWISEVDLKFLKTKEQENVIGSC